MRPLHILLAIATTAAWGFNFVFVKLGLTELPPFLLCALRFLFVSIPVVFFIPKPAIPLRLLVLYGLVTFALQFSLIFWGMNEGMPAGLSSIILQLQMVLSLFFAALFLRERLSILQIIGTLIALSGLWLVWLNVSHTASLLGFMLELGGAISLAASNLITRQIGYVNPISLVAWGCLISTPPLILISLVIEGPRLVFSSLQHASWLSLLSVSYTTFASTWFGYGAWSWLLSKYSVSSIISFTLLTPVFGMLGSLVILHEPLQPWKMKAAGLILLGLFIHIFSQQITARLRQRSAVTTIDSSVEA